MNNITKNRNKGFTLVEVIIAIAALGIICAVLLRLFVLAGDTNKHASGMQSAQLHVTSAAEVFAGSDSVEKALDYLGLNAADDITGSYTMEKDGLDILIDITKGDDDGYPGTLYQINLRALDGDKELAAIATAKYDKEALS